MKNKMKQFGILLLLPCFVTLLLFQTQAYAEEKVYCTASIPVEIKTLGDSVPSGIEYKVVIKSENETNPMPDVKEVTIKDNGKVEIGPMTYTKPGRYSQEAGNAEHFTYDSAVYTVTVSIENDGNGGLKSVIYAVENGATEKTDDVVFSNTYEAVTTSAVTTTAAPTVILEKPTTPKETVTVITNPPENAPKTGERIISAIVVGILGISMLVLSIVMNKKRKAEK